MWPSAPANTVGPVYPLTDLFRPRNLQPALQGQFTACNSDVLAASCFTKCYCLFVPGLSLKYQNQQHRSVIALLASCRAWHKDCSPWWLPSNSFLLPHDQLLPSGGYNRIIPYSEFCKSRTSRRPVNSLLKTFFLKYFML